MIKTSKEYGRMELAQVYCPTLTPDAAWRKLKRWIRYNKDLSAKLYELGYRPNQRCFTPRMVQEIYYFLGEP